MAKSTVSTTPSARPGRPKSGDLPTDAPDRYDEPNQEYSTGMDPEELRLESQRDFYVPPSEIDGHTPLTQSFSKDFYRYSQDFRDHRDGEGGQENNDYGIYRSRGETTSAPAPLDPLPLESDARIRHAIFEAFDDEDDIDATDVAVDVVDAIVRLGGSVRTDVMKQLVGDLVESVPGVREVANGIRVRRAH